MNYKIILKLEQKMRLSDLDYSNFPEIHSKNQWKKLIKSNIVYVNDSLGLTSTWANNNDCIEIKWLEMKAKVSPKTFPLNLDIVYEDDYLAVINKPAGIPVSGNVFKSVQNALSHNLTKSKAMSESDNFQTCHRLDFQTSGLLLISKTRKCRVLIGNMFENKIIQKKYYAITQGQLPNNSGKWEQPINGKISKSTYKVIKSVASIKNNRINLVELIPETGRTHQLRIHTALNNCPIVGDTKYGKQGNIMKGKGLFLNAFSLEFSHPITKDNISIKQPIPKKFNSLLEREIKMFNKHFTN
mgnify:CR=1 FL=1